MFPNFGAEYVKWVFLILLSVQGGGNDLLDYADTKTYWREEGVEMTVEALSKQLDAAPVQDISALIKDLGSRDWKVRDAAHKKILSMGSNVLPQLQKATTSDDPEIRLRAEALIRGLRQRTMGASVRRLMAIRALGELGDAKALPKLRPLLASEEPFVAEYARAAVARIEGKPFTRPRPPDDERLKDLAFLPKNSKMIYQVQLANDAEVSFPEAFKTGGKLLKGVELDDLTGQVTRVIAKQADVTGNIRVDTVSMGVALEDAPAMVMVIRGQYDPEQMCAWLQQLGFVRDEDEQRPTMRKGDGLAIICPSKERLVIASSFIFGRAPLESIAPGLNGEAGAGPAGDATMAALLKRIDTTSPFWVVMTTEGIGGPGGATPFDAIIGDSKAVEGGLRLRMLAMAKTPEGAKTLLEQGRSGVQQDLLKQLENTREQWDGLVAAENVLEGLKAMKLETEGNAAVFTVEVKNGRRLLAAMPATQLWQIIQLSEMARGGEFGPGDMDDDDDAWDQPVPDQDVDVIPIEPGEVPQVEEAVPEVEIEELPDDED